MHRLHQCLIRFTTTPTYIMSDDGTPEAPPAHTPFKDESAGTQSALACSLAAMILNAAEKELTEDNLNAVIGAAKAKASSSDVSAFASMFALEGVGENFDKFFPTPGSGGGGGGGGGGGDGGGAAEEEKKEEEEEEEIDMGGGDMFGGGDDDY